MRIYLFAIMVLCSGCAEWPLGNGKSFSNLFWEKSTKGNIESGSSVNGYGSSNGIRKVSFGEMHHAERRFIYGVSLLRQKRFNEAASLFKEVTEVLKNHPYSAQAYNNLGTVYLHLARYNEAEQAYRKALELDPKAFKAHFNLGNLYRRMNRYEDSIQSYKEFTHLNFGNDRFAADAFMEMGLAADAMNDGREAIIYTLEAKQWLLEQGDLEGLRQANTRLNWLYKKYDYNLEDFIHHPATPLEKLFAPFFDLLQLISLIFLI